MYLMVSTSKTSFPIYLIETSLNVKIFGRNSAESLLWPKLNIEKLAELAKYHYFGASLIIITLPSKYLQLMTVCEKVRNRLPEQPPDETMFLNRNCQSQIVAATCLHAPTYRYDLQKLMPPGFNHPIQFQFQ